MTRWTLACAAAVLAAVTMASAADPPASQPKDVVLDIGGNVKMTFVPIPAGKFTMGSPKDEEWRSVNEMQHEVTISKAFYMGVTEVTQEQYEAVMGKNPSKFKGAKNPVESVSWDDAVAFCVKLAEKSNRKLRLPTEAEWEYACRAGSAGAFNMPGKLADLAWFAFNGEKQTHPVAQKQANAWGLYDMHGNVWEWCSDYYATDYPKGPVTDPQGPGNGDTRVLRSSAWFDLAPTCRSAQRNAYSPDVRLSSFGFRVVLDSP